MRNELNLIRLIDRYLTNELEGEELEAFKARLLTDINLQEELENQKVILAGIERIGIKRDIQKASTKYFGKKGGWIAVVLFIALISTAFVFYTTQNDARYFPAAIDLVSDSVEVEIVEIQKPTEVFIDDEIESIETISKEIFELPQKAFQIFVIKTNRDTIIKGFEGTSIAIKANSFDSEIVTLKLKEFYKVSDMVFSNLTTLTGKNEIIETGGMLYLEAIASNGRKIELQNGAQIELKFPTKNRKPDMQLFSGQLNDSENMIWKLESNLIEIVESPSYEEIIEEAELFTIVEKMPVFPGCEGNSQEEVKKCSELKLRSFISSNILIPTEMRDKNINGKVYVSFVIDANGFVSNSSIIKGLNPILDAEVLRVINLLPQFTPGEQRGKNASVRYTLPVDFKIDGDEPMYSPSEIEARNVALQRERVRERKESLKEQEKRIRDVLSDTTAVGYKPMPSIIHDLENYVLKSANLGWINCDRFISDSRPKINYSLYNLEINSHVRVIFHSTKSILAGNWSNQQFRFSGVPLGEKVTIFAMKQEDGVPYICIQETSINREVPKLEFQKATIEKLKSYAEQINSIHN